VSTQVQGNIYTHTRDLNYSLHVCVFVHRCAELWKCWTHVEFIGVWAHTFLVLISFVY